MQEIKRRGQTSKFSTEAVFSSLTKGTITGLGFCDRGIWPSAGWWLTQLQRPAQSWYIFWCLANKIYTSIWLAKKIQTSWPLGGSPTLTPRISSWQHVLSNKAKVSNHQVTSFSSAICLSVGLSFGLPLLTTFSKSLHFKHLVCSLLIIFYANCKLFKTS